MMTRSLPLLCAMLLAGCDGLLTALGQPDHGEEVTLGDGTAQAFLETDMSGLPQRFGVTFDGSLDALPQDGPPVETLVPMPEAAEVMLPIDHVAVTWSPEGHPPPGVYDVSQLQVHFYVISQEERQEIEPGECQGTHLSCDALERATAPLPEAAQPPGYDSVGAVEPYMGDHLLDLMAPEFMGAPFENSWIWGAWDGRIAFMEPMMSRAYLETLAAEDCRPVPTPEAFTEPGWYPTVYCVGYDPGSGTYSVSLQGFTRFTTVSAL